MALRKAYQAVIKEDEKFMGGEVAIDITILPFAFSLDNGIVRIVQEGVDVYLSYDMIAKLHGFVFPSKSFICDPETQCVVEVPNHGTLTQEERLTMWARYPETRPENLTEEELSALQDTKTIKIIL